MKPDMDYVKKLVEALEATSKPHTDIEALNDHDASLKVADDDDPVFIFHLRILEDQRLVEGAGTRRGGSPDRALGYVYSADGQIHWSTVPIRLTANGHEFAQTLRNNDILGRLKAAALEVGPETVVGLAKAWFSHYVLNKFGPPGE